jgi:DNA-binding NarL/FixJ family response regulator
MRLIFVSVYKDALMTLKVLIADDHRLFRQGLISLMKTRDDLVEVIGEAQTGEEAVRMSASLHPDVIFMDIYMPQVDGLQAAREIKQRFPGIAVIMLTSSENDKHLYESIQLGASGYLLKSLDAAELFDLLEGVREGEVAMTRSMATQLMKVVARRSTDTGKGEETLTERELTVLRLVAGGASNPGIAEELSISVNTVKSHIKNILSKLQLENRTQAATYALQRGLVGLEGENSDD